MGSLSLMNRLSASARAAALIGAPLAIVALLGATVVDPPTQRIIMFFLITVVLALSVQVFSGPSGILTFGHVAFMGVGAYAGALLVIPPIIKKTIVPGMPAFVIEAHLPFAAALIGGLLVGGLFAAALGIVFARMDETAMSMASLSLLLVFGIVFNAAGRVTGGAQGLYAIPQATTIWVALGAAIVAVFLAQLFGRSHTGLQLYASRSSALGVRSLGTRLTALRWLAWTLAGAMVGFGGALWGGASLAFAPEAFGLELTFSVLAALVVGGIGSVTGTVLGAAVLTALLEVFREIQEATNVTGFAEIAFAASILLILILRPNGLLGSVELPEAITAWRARRGSPEDRE